ncbi:cupin domain-containing protein [Nakamurella aerolata]|uniref:cupin domain-containing protein n=1 Tax=Nakamurella aerolata TaxID=1656892 RepID=UPI001BB19A4B
MNQQPVPAVAGLSAAAGLSADQVRLSADQVRDLLALQPLPVEGGWFRRSFFDGTSSAIYYLLTAGEISALHRLQAPEVYHFYSGAPARLLVLHPDGSVDEPVLGTDLLAGQRPQLVVPAGSWQGASSTGEWSLVGTTMAPPYTDEQFTLADRADLTARYPAAAARIAELTR